MVSDKISDHMALHASLSCQRPHPERKEVFVRALRHINSDSLEANLAGIKIDFDCDDINVVAQYDTSLSGDIRALKAKRRKNEVIWRKNPLFVIFQIFQKSCMAVKYAIDENKTQTIHKRITDSNGDQYY